MKCSSFALGGILMALATACVSTPEAGDTGGGQLTNEDINLLATNGPEERASAPSGLDAGPQDALPFIEIHHRGFQTGDTDGGCTRASTSMAVSPGPDKYPLFLYFTGTRSDPDPDGGAGYDGLAAQQILQSMARGNEPHFAVSVDYNNDSNFNSIPDKLKCAYQLREKTSAPTPDCGNGQSSNSCSLLEVLCHNHPNVDCSTIAVWGFSQGATMAIWAHDFHQDKVKAAWLTGYATESFNGMTPTIPKANLRLVNGSGDRTQWAPGNTDIAKLQAITGRTCCQEPQNCSIFDCLDDGGTGSGWYLIQKDQLKNPRANAGHCWFDRATCNDGAISLDPAWTESANPLPFSLASTTQWLQERVRSARQGNPIGNPLARNSL